MTKPIQYYKVKKKKKRQKTIRSVKISKMLWSYIKWTLSVWHQQNLYFITVTKPGSLTQCAASQGLRHWGLQQRVYSHCSQERRWENWSQTHLSKSEGHGIIVEWSCDVCEARGKVSGNKEKVWSSSFCADITRLQASSWPVCPELLVLPCFEGGAPGPLTSKVTERTLAHAQWEGPLS